MEVFYYRDTERWINGRLTRTRLDVSPDQQQELLGLHVGGMDQSLTRHGQAMEKPPYSYIEVAIIYHAQKTVKIYISCAPRRMYGRVTIMDVFMQRISFALLSYRVHSLLLGFISLISYAWFTVHCAFFRAYALRAIW